MSEFWSFILVKLFYGSINAPKTPSLPTHRGSAWLFGSPNPRINFVYFGTWASQFHVYVFGHRVHPKVKLEYFGYGNGNILPGRSLGPLQRKRGLGIAGFDPESWVRFWGRERVGSLHWDSTRGPPTGGPGEAATAGHEGRFVRSRRAPGASVHASPLRPRDRRDAERRRGTNGAPPADLSSPLPHQPERARGCFRATNMQMQSGSAANERRAETRSGRGRGSRLAPGPPIGARAPAPSSLRGGAFCDATRAAQFGWSG